jgi:hypothetical protein
MFWPGMITMAHQGIKVWEATVRAFVTQEMEQRAMIDVWALEKARALERLQRNLDDHMYENQPWSPIIREQETVPEGDGRLFICKARWLTENWNGIKPGQVYAP